jgi:hypothetical protein
MGRYESLLFWLFAIIMGTYGIFYVLPVIVQTMALLGGLSL